MRPWRRCLPANHAHSDRPSWNCRPDANVGMPARDGTSPTRPRTGHSEFKIACLR